MDRSEDLVTFRGTITFQGKNPSLLLPRPSSLFLFCVPYDTNTTKIVTYRDKYRLREISSENKKKGGGGKWGFDARGFGCKE